MLKCILVILFIIPAMLGLAEFFHAIRIFCISPAKRPLTYSVILLDNSCPEQQLTYAHEQLLWFGNTFADRIIAVNSGLSDEKKEICRQIAKNKNIIFCEAKELASQIAALYSL